jgi:hypothetical protein
MDIQLHTISRLIKRTVEGRNEEHKHLSSHAEEKEEVGTWQVSQLKKRT